MITTQKKLITLTIPVINSIRSKARAKNMTFKRYVEELITEDAGKDDKLPVIPDEVSDIGLISLAGIINSKSLKEMKDDRVDYILSKL